MALKPYQTVLALNTLYAVQELQYNPVVPDTGIPEQVQANIEVIGGTVNIFGSQLFPASPTTGMFNSAAGFVGIDAFGVVPNYLYITQASGTTTSIIVTGLSVKANPTS